MLTQNILSWFDAHGRKDLPWQDPITPYRVWLSEIMLQQTQVNTVIPYFLTFAEKFPSVSELASAELDDVLHLWSGLGYYARARNLYRTAQIVAHDYNGDFPDSLEGLQALPGIGRSTAGAILSIAFHTPTPILDGNVKRVLVRFHAIEGWPGTKENVQLLWDLSTKNTPQKRIADYTQAIMDLGAMVCTRTKPNCTECPLTSDCQAYANNLQNTLPHSKPRKALPVKSIQMLVLKNERDEILLEQRPPVGIWGGLWSLPECPHDEDIQVWSKQQWGLSIKSLKTLPSFRHTFSHYHLDITPVCAQLGQSSRQVMENQPTTWYKSGQSKQIGLAAPISKILEESCDKPAE